MKSGIGTNKGLAIFLVLILSIFCAGITNAQVVINVTTNAGDNSPGSLREAIRTANMLPGDDTIKFVGLANPDVITIADSAFSTILENLVILGGDSITVDGDKLFRIFEVPTSTMNVTLRIDNLRMIDGFTAGTGGAILFEPMVAGTMVLNHCEFIGNTAGGVGGGGAINMVNDGEIDKCYFQNDSALAVGGRGGAISTSNGTVNISNSTFTECYSDANGGAIDLGVNTISALDKLTIFDCFAGTFGGAIREASGNAGNTLTNSTIHNNTALAAFGGGIYIDNASTFTLNSNTITDNTAGVNGGGIRAEAGNTLVIGNSIVANNTAPTGADLDDAGGTGTITSNGYNWITDAGGHTALAAAGDNDPAVSPDLGVLQDNGGCTWTRLPNTGSPVVGIGDPVPLTDDQRDVTRSSPTTIGAVEAACPLAEFIADTVCSNVPTTFVNLSTHPVLPGYVYRWNFDSDGFIDLTGNYFTGDSIQYQYPSPGTYTATLVIIPPIGCNPDTFVMDILVEDNPQPRFVVDSVVCVNTTVTFFDSTVADTPNDLHYFWTFPPSSPVELAPGNATRLFSTPGNFNITLEVVDSLTGCNASFTDQITVQDPPVAFVQLDGQTRDTFEICIGDVVFFNDSSIAAATPTIHQLIFSGGHVDTTYSPSNISLQFDTAGAFDVTYIVGPADTNCQGSTSFHLIVNDGPVISGFVVDTVCFGDSTDFTLSVALAGGTGIDSFVFANSDNSILFTITDTAQRAFVWPTQGEDSVFVTAYDANGCASNTLFDTIIVYDTITGAAFVTDTVCALDSVYLEINLTGDTGVTNYGWDYDDDLVFDASTGTTNNDSAIYSNGGLLDFNVEVTYGYGNCVDTFGGQVRIAGLPAMTTLTDTVCQGDLSIVQIVVDSVDVLGQADTTYYFDFDATWPPFSIMRTINDTASNTFAGFGNFPVAFAIEDAFGCTDTIVDTTIVLPNPIVASTAGDTSCFGDSLSLTIFDTFAVDLVYYWDYSGDDSIAEVSDTINTTMGADGFYLYPNWGDSIVNVWIVSLDGCTSDTLQDTVKIIRPIVVAPVLPRDTACAFDSLSVRFNVLEVDTTMGFDMATNWAIMFDYDNNDTTDRTTTGFLTTDTLTDSVAYAVFVDGWINYQYIPRYDDGVFNCRTVTTPPVIDTLLDSVFVFGAADISFVKTDTSCPGGNLLVQVTNNGSALTSLKYFYNFDSTANNAEVHATSYADTFINWAVFTPGNYNFAAWAIDTTFGCGSDTAYANELGDSFRVRQNPMANFYAGVFCDNEPVTLVDTSTWVELFMAGLDSSYWDIDSSGMAAADIANSTAPFGATLSLPGPVLYDVTYTIVDSFGCQDDTTAQFFVRNAPVANFDLDSVCYGIASYFADSSTTTDSSLYSWDFDGGAFEVIDSLVLLSGTGDYEHLYTVVPPSTFPFSDFYDVTLIVVDSLGCSDTLTRSSAVVSTQPEIHDFTADTVCFDDLVTFFSDVSSATSISLAYDFWADTTLTINVPVATNPNTTTAPVGYYTTGGTYLARLRAVNGNSGCETDSFINFYIRNLPFIDVEIDTVCFGDMNTFVSVSRFDSLVDSATFYWNVRNTGTFINTPFDSINGISGIQSGANDTITPIIDVAGAYINSLPDNRLVLAITDEYGCTDTLINDEPYVVRNPSFTINTDTVCFGSPTTMDATLINFDSITDFNNIMYQWYIDSNFVTSFNPDTFYTYPDANDRTDSVSLTVSAPTTVAGLTCSSTRSDSTVYVKLTPMVTINTDTVCFGNPTTFDVVTIQIDPLATDTTFTWSTVNEGTFSTPDPDDVMYVLGATGADSATLIVADDIGCADTIGDGTLWVNANPTATINTDTVCFGTPTSFEVVTLSVSTAATDTTFEWIALNEGQISFPDPDDLSYTLANSGADVALLVLTDDRGCTDTITDSTLYVYGNPMATINTDTVCSGQPTTFEVVTLFIDPASSDTTYAWSTVNEGAISTSQDTMYILAAAGGDSATLVITDDLGCTTTYGDGTVYVNQSPVLTAINTDTACFGAPTTFEAISFTVDPGASDTFFIWSTANDGIFSNGDTGTVQYAVGAPGPDVAQLVVIDNGGCSDTLTDNTLFVLTSPTVSINTDTVCRGTATFFDMISFTTDAAATDTTFIWSTVNEGVISNADTADVMHILANAGPDSATLVVVDNQGCEGIAGDGSLYVIVTPTGTFNTDTVCFGTPTRFEITSLVAEPTATDTSFQWFTVNEGLISDDSLYVDHVMGAPGADIAILILGDDLGCSDTLVDSTLYVVANPTAVINTDTACFGQGPNTFDLISFTTDPIATDTTFTWITTQEGLLSSGSTEDITHNKTVSGQDTAIFIIFDNFGCVDTVTDNTLYASVPPVVAFLDGDSVCLRDSNTFSYVIVNDPATFGDSLFWDFDFPGFTQTLIETKLTVNDTISDVTLYSYPQTGNYTVELSVVDNLGCFTFNNFTVAGVDTSPNADFTADTVCAGTPTIFTLQGTNTPFFDFTYLWDFDNNGATDATAPTNTQFTYTASGTYLAQLVVISNVNGCADSVTVPVSVRNTPSAVFNYNIDCAGDSIDFFALAGDGLGYFWNFDVPGGDTLTTFNPNVNYMYDTGGLKAVRLLVIDTITGCFDTLTQPVNASVGGVSANFTVVDDTICQGEEATFIPIGIPVAVLVSWDFDGNGTVDNTTNDTVTNRYFVDGQFDATFIVDDGLGCVDSSSLTITVIEGPDAEIECDTVCVGENSTITDLSSGSNLSYAWDYDNNGTTDGTTAGNQTILIDSVTTSTVVLTLTDAVTGCVDTDTCTLQVVEIVQLSFILDSTLCEDGAVVTLTGTPNTGTFRVNGIVTNTIDPSNFLPGTQLTVTYDDTATCPSPTVSQTVTITSNPSIVASIDTLIIINYTTTLSATGGNTYSWTPAFDVVSGDPNQADVVVLPRQTTTYTVVGTDANGCQGTDEVVVTVREDPRIQPANAFSPNGDGVNDEWFIGNILAYPNAQVTVFTRWGEVIYSTQGYVKPWNGIYLRKDLPTGTYYYVIDLNDGGTPISGHVDLKR